MSFILNGLAPRYPLAVGFTVSGTAGADDHDLASGVVVFQEGELERSLVVNLADDGTPDAGESLVVSLHSEGDDAVAANLGVKREQRLTIVEKNLPPEVELSFYQGEEQVRTFFADGGPGQVVLSIKDPNANDSHTPRWTLPQELVPLSQDAGALVFDPTQLEPGLYEVEVMVTEEGTAPLSTTTRKTFRVSASRPPLSASSDIDGDGANDAVEGPADVDGDGQADYLDPNRLLNVVNQAAKDGLKFLVESSPGTRLELGDYALVQADGVGISPEEIGNQDTAETSVKVNGTYVDFQVRGLPPGATADIVIPQRQPVPEGAIYRKFSKGVWVPFILDAENKLASARGQEGACPPAGSDAYRSGLNAGDWCIQVSMNDGGPNDADAEMNGVIRDPGGISALDESEYKTTGGAGSVGWGSLILLLLAIAGVLPKVRAGLPILLLGGGLMLVVRPGTASAAELITAFDPLYLSGNIAYATTGADAEAMDQRFMEKGLSANTLSIDAGRYSWSVGVGYRATARVSLEARYVNLGDVNLRFESTTPGADIKDIHPESGHGVAFAGVYRQPITQRMGASARLGMFVWEGDFETYQNGLAVTQSHERSRDAFYGVGLDYILSPEWSISIEGQRYEFSKDPAHAVGLGVQFRFFEMMSRMF